VPLLFAQDTDTGSSMCASAYIRVGKWDFEIRLRNSRPISARPTLISELRKPGWGWAGKGIFTATQKVNLLENGL